MSLLEYSEKTRVKSISENAHQCQICPYFSASVFFFTNHVRRHNSSFPAFNCENRNVENYYCKDCSFETNLTILLKVHIIKYHGIKTEEQEPNVANIIQEYCCNNCNFVTHFSVKLLEHTTHCVRKSVVWNQCKQCSYRTTNKTSLKNHVVLHHADEKHIKWHKCKKCPYKAKLKVYLSRHVNAVHVEHKFKCDKCTYGTHQRKSLQQHIIHKHKELILYRCEKCPYECIQKCALEFHVKQTHFNEQDFDIKCHQCDQCSYKSNQMKNLERHVKRMHFKGNDDKKGVEGGSCLLKQLVMDIWKGT